MAGLGRLRVKLKSYDHRVIDEAVVKIIDTAMATGAKIKGPIPLPTKRTLIPIVPSTSRGIKNAQEHFEVLVHKRLVDILDPSSRTIDSLSNLDLPAGVSIEIKM
ncbi:30S ribosomal protein S10 [Candidatus Woesebacteria bacterium RIFCSPHIGHO2_01_FULL_39_17]|nr:MAG: 30S ribosomal protein S10, small subunit ribosomal protein S10 [Microgenomates group bacterium GW2011_GWC1_38_12]OGM23816.1 MAG: 30S ribosomal protein S10 [Candidatus Woesebacteria bacterium RIFCSPHIGHO2_01_FULL_39_17]OGM61240.1 MAG: 30S ribosomal protein S10 [Candidatus Woesebacteria bacterium RIFCSPLOWO2_01_FULL_39_14]